MATSREFAAFVTEQLGGEKQGVTCRKMFGEYGVFGYGKVFALICDDTLFLKPTPGAAAILEARGLLVMAPAYEGSKDFFRMEELDDTELLGMLRDVTLNALPEPKPKKPKKAKTPKPSGQEQSNRI